MKCFNLMAAGLGILVLVSCSAGNTGGGDAAAPAGVGADPFVGFFAAPGVGQVEITAPDGRGVYHGVAQIGAETPLEVWPQGDELVGKLDVDGPSRRVEIERASGGILVTLDGVAGGTVLKRYGSRAEYEEWLKGMTPAP